MTDRDDREVSGVRIAPAQVVAAEHHAAAERGTDKEVEKVVDLAAMPVQQFAAGGGGAVVLDNDREPGRPLQGTLQVEAVPGTQGFRLQPEFEQPASKIVGRGDTEAGQPRGGGGSKPPAEAQHVAGKSLDGLFRLGQAVDHHPLNDIALQVDEHRLDHVAVDAYADGVGSGGVEFQHRGRLATSAIPLADRAYEAVVLELADDHAGGVVREADPASEVRLRGWPEAAQGRQHDPLVEIADDDRVRAVTGCARLSHGPSSRRSPVCRAYYVILY